MSAMIIPLNGWAAGERKYSFEADSEFFQTFGNTEIQDASVKADVLVKRYGEHKADVCLKLSGSLTVPCDRCLEPLTLPVEVSQAFRVCFSDEDEERFSADGKESLSLVPGSLDVDMSQAVYDYACLSLPIQRVHPEGECNPDTVRFLSQEPKDEEAAPSSPFAALKGLFEKSNN
ncbi:MAG: DUF177 domain-containing protein [Bacteroidales bacterium]|nr:DUF177 domain-containing protein [Bacteroidales bacterium]